MRGEACSQFKGAWAREDRNHDGPALCCAFLGHNVETAIRHRPGVRNLFPFLYEPVSLILANLGNNAQTI